MHVTVLQTNEGTEVRKRFIDGEEVKDHFKIPEYWWASSYDLDLHGLHHLYRRPSEVVDGLIDRPNEVLCLGKPDYNRRDESGILEHRSNTSRRGWVAPPSDILVIDGDGIPYPAGYNDQTLIERPRETIQSVLVSLGLSECGCLVVLSSKAGLAGNFRAHIFVQLSELYTFESLNDFLKQTKKTASWIDPVMQPSRLLFSCRPMLEDEHLPERVFMFKGGYLTLPLASTEGMVQLSKPVQRGKFNLYQMNSELLQASEFVSEQCFNFVLSAKRAGMDEDAAVDALRAEFEHINVPFKTWKRMANRNGTLGEARRMYRSIRAGASTVYGNPAFVEPATTLDAASEELRAAIADQIGSGGGTFLNKVTLGVGKTHEIVDLVTSNDIKTLILAPSHERCAEIVERLEAAREKRLWTVMDEIGQFDDFEERYLERPWAAWRGRSAEGMCSRLEAVNAAFKAGVSVHKHICGFPSEGDDDNMERCPNFSTCAYAEQVMNFWRHNWVAPVAMISHLSRIASGVDVVIIDEGCVDELAGGRTVPLEDLLAPRDGELGQLSHQAHSDLLKDERTLTPEQVTQALELELEAKPTPHIEPGMSDDEIVERCNPGSYRSGCVSIWRALQAEFEGGHNHLHTWAHVYKEDTGEEKTRWLTNVAWRTKPRLLEKVDTVLLFDATPNITALKAHWPDLQVVDVEAPNMNLDVVQVSDAVGKRSQLINDLPKTDPKYKTEEARVRKARAKVAGWLKAQPGYTIVVTKKAHREAIEAEHTFERVSFAHHGNVEGQDAWDFPDGTRLRGAEVDNLVVLGRSTPQPYVLEQIARQHHCDEEPIIKMPWYRTEHWELANGIAGYRLRHEDQRVDAVIQNVAVDGQMQAIGRMRGVRRAKRGRVFIMHSMRLDIAVTECVSAAAMMRRVGDVTLLSRKEVARVFGVPDSAASRGLKGVTATHKYWREDGQTQPYKCAIAPGADVDRCMVELGASKWSAV